MGIPNLSEILGVGLSTVIVGGLLIRAATSKHLSFGATDLLIGLYIGWCAAIFLIYYDKATLQQFAKYVIPLATYVAVKHVIQNRREHLGILRLMIIGFAAPVVISAGMILLGEGVDVVNYWTGAPRYKGAFSNPHDMAHQVTFLVMIVWLYMLLREANLPAIPRSVGAVAKISLVMLSLLALYCLYMSAVRTTMVGLFVFSAVLLIIHYKNRLLVAAIGAIAIAAFFLVEPVKQHLFREAAQAQLDKNFDAAEYGSGRPRIWADYLRAFFQMPIDRQVAGVGIGNSSLHGKKDSDWLYFDGHNDFLDVMVFTGYVGLALYLAIHAAFFLRIMNLRAVEREVFLALFISVMVMNFLSNSYFTRFSLAQMFYMVLAYIELREGRREQGEGVAAMLKATLRN